MTLMTGIYTCRGGTEADAGGYVVDPAPFAWVVHLIVKHFKSTKEKPDGFVTQTNFDYLLLNIYLPASSPPIVPVAGEKGDEGPNCTGNGPYCWDLCRLNHSGNTEGHLFVPEGTYKKGFWREPAFACLDGTSVGRAL
jgi:hypothetical protein